MKASPQNTEARPVNEAAVEAILRSCPMAGEGVNRWLFPASLRLHRIGIPPNRIEELLEKATADCGRELKADEISRAVRNSAPEALKDKKFYRRWPLRNYEQIEAIGCAGFGVTNLESNSPVPIIENGAEKIIDALFPDNPLLCAGVSLEKAETCSREQWRGLLSQLQFIVASPMSKHRGATAEGHLSFRSLKNTGPRKFLPVEFDFVEIDENCRDTAAAPMLRRLKKLGVTIPDLCAGVLAELAKLRPLALVVHSGGKSLHGWFPCDGERERTMRRFMRLAVSLGADAATWTRNQLVRMPDGRRDNGKRQRVLYFNPAVLNGELK